MNDPERLEAAFRAGEALGGTLGSYAGECPYATGGQHDLRKVWMDGFSAGRVSRMSGAEAGKVQGGSEGSAGAVDWLAYLTQEDLRDVAARSGTARA